MKMEKSDKIVAIISIVISLISAGEMLFGFIPVPPEIDQLARIVAAFTTCCSLFLAVVTFLFSRFESRNNLKSIVNDGLVLSKDGRIPDSQLLVIESDLDSCFNCKNGSYHIIVISSCVDGNEEIFMKAIWNNVSNGVRYLYVTPESNQKFYNMMLNQFVMEKDNVQLNEVYDIVTRNILHISDLELFAILPKEFDLCVYFRDSNQQTAKENWRGYYSMMWLKNSEEKTIAYYYPMSPELVERIHDGYLHKFDCERMLPTYISPKIEKNLSSIHGHGYFCKSGESIKKGERLIIKGGHVLHRKDVFSNGAIDSYMPIADDLFLGAKTQEEVEDVKLFVNHSCEPNMRIDGDRTFVALKNIGAGEELTTDYAFIDNEDNEFICNCKTASCRHCITGFDWKKTDIQKKYGRNCFSNYLKEKITK